MNAKTLLLAIGGIVLLGGLVFGFVPIKAHGVSCGSAMHASNDADVADLARALQADTSGLGTLDELSLNANACDDRRSIYKPIAWTLMVAGGVLMLIGVAAPGKAATTGPGAVTV